MQLGISPPRGIQAATQPGRVPAVQSLMSHPLAESGPRGSGLRLAERAAAERPGGERARVQSAPGWVPAWESSGAAIALEPAAAQHHQPPTEDALHGFMRDLEMCINGAWRWQCDLMKFTAGTLGQARAAHGFFQQVMKIIVKCRQWAGSVPLHHEGAANVEAARLMQSARKQLAKACWVDGLYDLVRAVGHDPLNAAAIRELVTRSEKVSAQAMNIFGSVPNPWKFIEDTDRIVGELFAAHTANERMPGNVVRLESLRDVCRRLQDTCERWQTDAANLTGAAASDDAARITADAHLNLNAGNWSRALRQLSSALRLDPCHAPALSSIIECARSLQQKTETRISQVPQQWQQVQRQFERRDRMIDEWAAASVSPRGR